MKTRISLAGLAGVSLLCLMTATAHGAAPAPVATDKVDEAKQQAEVRGELRAAIISARNDVKTSPASVDAHEKLGQLLLRSGDGVGAEKEARAMRDNGADPTRWAPILSRGFAMQGVPERTLREVRADGLQGAARGAALAALADAKISLKRYDEAARDLKEAEDLQPAAAEPRIATARLYLTTNRPAEALIKLQEAQALNDSGEVWLLTGATHTQLNQPDEAIAAFTKAIEKEPRNAVAYAERAAVRLSKGDEAAGLEDADRALAIAPNYATPNYLKALVMARRNDLKAADALLVKVTPRLGDLPRGWFLLAAVKNGLGELEQAQVAIGKFQSRYPEDVAGQRLAGIVALRRGDLPKAIDALKSVTTLEPTDAQSFDLLGRAYAMSGDVTTALAQFQKAASLAPKDATLSTRAAVAQLQTGDEKGGVQALEQALVLDPGFGPAAELVFFTYLRDEKFDAAAGVVDQFAQKNPDNPSAGLFRGLLANAKGDAAGADAAYRETIAKYPKFMPARLNVAEAQLASGHPELAEATYGEMLAIEPRNLGALGGLSQIYLHSKRSAELVQMWDKAVKAGPDSPQMVSALIDAQLQNGDQKAALATARNFATAHGNDAEALLIRAHVEAAANAPDEAVASLRRAIELQPKNVNIRRELAGMLVRKNELDDAEKLLQETLRMAPSNDALLTDMVALAMKRSPDAGFRAAERFAAEYPDRPAAQSLPGDALAVAGKFDEAAQRFAKLNEQHPSAPVTVRLANALVRAGKQREAIVALDAWMASSPKDTQVHLLLAGLLLETGALDRARTEYEKLDVERRDDPVVLNNLAWIYQQQNNPKATSLARRAMLLRPNDPTVLDTYGWILTSSGKPAEGVRYLQRAVFAQPGNKDMNFHLGATHARLGNKAEALKLLRPLLTEKATYQGDVQILVKQLES